MSRSRSEAKFRPLRVQKGAQVSVYLGGGPLKPKPFHPDELIDNAEASPTQMIDLRRKLSALGKVNAKVILYSDLPKYRSLSQLLGSEGVIILIRQTPTFGHWVALVPGPEPGVVSYFDSYGYGIDELLRDQDPEMALKVGQAQPHLTNLINQALMNDEIERVDINTKKLQNPTESVAACGAYAVLRILWNNYSNNDFIHLISDPSGSGSVTDRNVSLLTALL